KPDNPKLEEAIFTWIKQAIKNELTLSGYLLQAKTKKLANQFKITEFNASNGEASNIPLEDILKFCLELQDILQNYEPKDIFNCDETALF
ncbi:2781_t:CDS:2, partial [Dentiscutata erythropus]